MYWRLPAREYAAGKGEPNRRALQALVRRGEASGVIAYDAGVPIGWCAIEPRSAFVRLQSSRVLRSPETPAQAEGVWAAPCLFVKAEYRRRGVSVELLRAAVAHARSRGARCVEGYPVLPKAAPLPGPFAWTGVLPAFKAAGFAEFARVSPARPIMRCPCK